MAYYEYETSPRKLRPEYERETYKVPVARKKVNTQSTKKKTTKSSQKVLTIHDFFFMLFSRDLSSNGIPLPIYFHSSKINIYE